MSNSIKACEILLIGFLFPLTIIYFGLSRYILFFIWLVFFYTLFVYVFFYKSKNSGRWWMGVPFRKEGVKELQDYYVACSYRDYEIANQGEIPERWLKTLNKFL